MLRSTENLIAQNCAVKKLFHHSTYESRGRYFKEYLMNRDGFSLVVMGFTGKEALDWKLKYIKAFNAMEGFIRERQSTEWLTTRKNGKMVRRNETDTLANLIDYAKQQGSRNADKFYMTYSRLVNSLVGIEAGQRGRCPWKTLMAITMLEDMILHTVDEEMQKGTHYKQIYPVCKDKGAQMVQFMYLPKWEPQEVLAV
ncbi:MAG: Rha family transcriptional regulator [Bacteroidales bacterium]|nr:Rha family transcriptional regulator [Bacteroidales bacterium]